MSDAYKKREEDAVIAADHLVGNVLLKPSQFAALAAKVTVDAFPSGTARVAWELMTSLATDGRVTAGGIEAAFARGGISKEYVADLQRRILPEKVDALMKYVETILYFDGLRRAEQVGLRLADSARKGISSGEDLVGKAMTELVRAISPQGQLSPIENAVSEIEAVLETGGRPGAGLGYQTGFDALDVYLSLYDGVCLTLAGRPSMGKSQLAFQIALAVANQIVATGDKGCVAIFSTEMPEADVALRLTQSMCGVSTHRFKRGELNLTEKENLRTAAEALRKLPIYIDSSSAPTIAEVAFRATALHQRSPIRLLIFDYIENSGETNDSEERRVSATAKGLKGLSVSLKTCVLMLSQLSRKVEDRPDKRPQLSDLRYSGDIEAASDAVVTMLRPGYYIERGIKGVYLASDADADNVCYAFVAKNRNGPTGEAKLAWDKGFSRFVPYQSEEGDPFRGKTNSDKKDPTDLREAWNRVARQTWEE